jgi:hypothetical protein
MNTLVHKTAVLILEAWNHNVNIDHVLMYTAIKTYSETETPLLPLLIALIQHEPSEQVAVILCPIVCESYRLFWLKERLNKLGFPTPEPALSALWRLSQYNLDFVIEGL